MVSVSRCVVCVAHAWEYRLRNMAADNLTAVLYEVNDLRLVSCCTKSVELCSGHDSSLHVTAV